MSSIMIRRQAANKVNVQNRTQFDVRLWIMVSNTTRSFRVQSMKSRTITATESSTEESISLVDQFTEKLDLDIGKIHDLLSSRTLASLIVFECAREEIERTDLYEEAEKQRFAFVNECTPMNLSKIGKRVMSWAEMSVATEDSEVPQNQMMSTL